MSKMTQPKQRTPDWEFERAGMLTASNFAAAMGICPYKSRKKLWREMKGLEPAFLGNPATDWGTEHEADAISAYEVLTGNLVEPVGFIAHQTFVWIGASPDGLVGEDGLVECKAPYSQKVHETVPAHYMAQMQGQLFITGREWCDFVSWTPDTINIFKVYKSKDYCDWMFALLNEFLEYVHSDKEPHRLNKKPIPPEVNYARR